MRLAAITPILCLLFGGCNTTEPTRPNTWRTQFAAGDAVLGDKVVQLDIAVIEQPLGDLYINKELWEQTDTQVVDLEKQAVLDRNGFRVGQLVGSPPAKLQSLLTSERWCLNPRRRVVQSGYVFAQPLGSVRPHCEFRIQENDRPVVLRLDDVECQLEIEPTLKSNGSTRLRFTPKLEYGKSGPIYKSSETGWAMEVKKPAGTFPTESWQLELDPNEMIVIGALLDQRDSLGYQSFVTEGLTPVQRLLVIRTTRSPAETPIASSEHFEQSPPLALQATGTIRASRP